MNWKDRNKTPSKARAEKLAKDYTTAAGVLGVKVDQTKVEERDLSMSAEDQARAAYKVDGCTCSLHVKPVAHPEFGITVLAVSHTSDCALNMDLFSDDIPEAG